MDREKIEQPALPRDPVTGRFTVPRPGPDSIAVRSKKLSIVFDPDRREVVYDRAQRRGPFGGPARVCRMPIDHIVSVDIVFVSTNDSSSWYDFRLELDAVGAQRWGTSTMGIRFSDTDRELRMADFIHLREVLHPLVDPVIKAETAGQATAATLDDLKRRHQQGELSDDEYVAARKRFLFGD